MLFVVRCVPARGSTFLVSRFEPLLISLMALYFEESKTSFGWMRAAASAIAELLSILALPTAAVSPFAGSLRAPALFSFLVILANCWSHRVVFKNCRIICH